MKLLVVGSGGREHAIAKKLLESPQVNQVFVAPGNDGMTLDGLDLVNIGITEHSKLIDFAKANDIAWTFIGPDDALATGIVDDFNAAGLKAFGPSKAAAELEWSKDFAKSIMAKYHVPTAAYGTFSDFEQAKSYIEEHGAPIVVKADGLALGMIAEGRPYLGVLYAGLILTADGPKVIEFNSRFGDPETQVILPRLTSDFAQNITDILDGKAPEITWTDKGVTLGVVVASEGYPVAYEKGVRLPEKTSGDIITYYAGAKFADDKALLSNGGRVYMLVTTKEDVKSAQDAIYAELATQDTTGLFYRNDIGSKAIGR